MVVFKKNMIVFYFEDVFKEFFYVRIVNGKYYNCVKGYVDDVMLKGVKMEVGGNFDES